MPRTKQFDKSIVLQKAVELFWKQGYHATSMQDLVDHLGINRASLYDTFGGKRELFDLALETYQTEYLSNLREVLFSHENTLDGIRALLEHCIDESIADTDLKGCFVVNTTTEMIPGDDEILFRIMENKNQFEGMLEEYLRLGIDNGYLPSDVKIESVASFLYSQYAGFKVVAKISAFKGTLMAIVDTTMGILTKKD